MRILLKSSLEVVSSKDGIYMDVISSVMQLLRRLPAFSVATALVPVCPLLTI